MTAPYLFVVFEAARPLAGGARVRCAELDEIVIGRGSERALAQSAHRRAALALPDRRMSRAHARICRVPDGWVLVDMDSKNGCHVDGCSSARTALRDGAWIVLGQTLLRFRTALAEPTAEPLWCDASALPPVVGVATLVPSFAAQLAELARIAASGVSLLLGGETGTGKELVARGVHTASGRAGPFVAVNCASSGALADPEGFVRSADNGTLLLDEIGDLALLAQAALLRVLQARELPVDVRIIAATHRDLAALATTGAFCSDLFARLAGRVETLPPLAARREDTGTLVAAALRKHAGPRAAEARFSIGAAARLVRTPWPHNVRQLDKAIEAALALADGALIDASHLPREPPVHELDDAALRERLAALLVEHRGNISQIARALGKARMQVQRWLKRFALDPDEHR